MVSMQTRMQNHAQIKWFSLWTDQMILFRKAQYLGFQRVSGSDKTPDLKRRLKSRETGSYIWKGLWTWNLLIIYICVIWYKYKETESFMEAVWVWITGTITVYIPQSLTPRWTLLLICFFVCFFLCEEEGATTFLISHRTIRRELKLARIPVTKTVGSDGMSYFFLLFISPFSRRLLSPIRDVQQRTTNAARFVIYCVKL